MSYKLERINSTAANTVSVVSELPLDISFLLCRKNSLQEIALQKKSYCKALQAKVFKPIKANPIIELRAVADGL